MPLESAVDLAIRVKRGLRDPNRPGGATKDHGYLSGLLKLRQMPADDVAALRATKWPIVMLPVIRELFDEGVLHNPELVFDADLLQRAGVAP